MVAAKKSTGWRPWTTLFGMIAENFWQIFWRHNCRSLIGVVENFRLCNFYLIIFTEKMWKMCCKKWQYVWGRTIGSSPCLPSSYSSRWCSFHSIKLKKKKKLEKFKNWSDLLNNVCSSNICGKYTSNLLLCLLQILLEQTLLNGIKLILDDQVNHLDSCKSCLESVRYFRGPLFRKPVTVSSSKPALFRNQSETIFLKLLFDNFDKNVSNFL